MPELPEVETVVRDLRALLIPSVITKEIRSKQSLRRPWNFSINRPMSILQIQRRGKWILVELDFGILAIHLGMTGQMSVVPAITEVESHVHFRFVLRDGREWRYRDIRRFGSIEWFPSFAKWQSQLEERLGPDPWEVSEEDWCVHTSKCKKNLKALLLDQTVMAGVGNIYADESCFRARLHPQRLANQLTHEQALSLLHQVRDVLITAIENRGSTIRNYVGGSGLEGEFQNHLQVYGRTHEPCVVCGSMIECIRLAGRSTHYCPTCQRL